jgi:signal transduction histidine kinase
VGEQASAIVRTRPIFQLLSVQVPPVGGSTARLFAVNPSSRMATAAGLRSLVAIAREAGPTLLVQHELQRLEKQAEVEARSRLARELHDGVIQSLIAVQMRTQALQRRGAEGVSCTELRLIQEQLGEPITALRELTEHLRYPTLAAHDLVNHITRLVAAFERESGIPAALHAEAMHLDLSPRRCREVALVVQEALVNIQRHSGARHVQVRLLRREHGCELVIADDGKGFPFAGVLTHDELDATRQGPLVIRERVRAIGGELTIESTPGQGSQLTIRLLRSGSSVHV